MMKGVNFTLRYIVSTFINFTMYPWYNNNIATYIQKKYLRERKEKKKSAGQGVGDWLTPVIQATWLVLELLFVNSDQRNTQESLSKAKRKVLLQPAKPLVPSYYCLYSLYNKIRGKGKIVSAGY
jgi:hypothetical protein